MRVSALASYYGSANFGTGSNHLPGLDDDHGRDIFLTGALTLEMDQAIEQPVTDGVPFLAYMAHDAVHAPSQTDPRFTTNYPGLGGTELAYATSIEGRDKSPGDLLTPSSICFPPCRGSRMCRSPTRWTW